MLRHASFVVSHLFSVNALVGVEIVVLRVEGYRAVDFQKCLRIVIALFNKSKIHVSNAHLGCVERGAEIGIQHQALPAVFRRPCSWPTFCLWFRALV